MVKNDTWQKSDTHSFWEEIAPCNHLVQIYESEEIFLGLLEDFVTTGINVGEAVIVIATEEHLNNLEQRLLARGVDITNLIADDQYIPLDAEKTLNTFMVIGWPDKELFTQVVTQVIDRAKAKGRKARAFGEMVALLWAKGQNGATVQLEYLWNRYCEKEELCLLCAYPKSGFSENNESSISHICANHTKIIAGWQPEVKGQIIYQSGGY